MKSSKQQNYTLIIHRFIC